jgi:hypothetical protein
MHALLAHAYHLALLPIHVVMLPVWRPLVVCLFVALAIRLAGFGAMAAGFAVLAGWVAQDMAWLGAWPPPPVARLPGLALILLAESLLRQRGKGTGGWWILPVSAALGAWWLRGAPVSGPAVLRCMPVFLGLVAALPLARLLARDDSGWGGIGASLALAGGLWVTGASPHWARAALVPAVSAAALLGLTDAAPVLAGVIVMASAAALVASDRGRLVPVDAACLVPLLAWALAPRLAPRLARSSPAVAGLAAAALCIGLAWVARRALAGD